MATGVAEPLPPSTTTGPTYTYPPVIIILTIILLIFFFAGFFSIYFCRCFMQNLLCTWHLRRSSTGTPAAGATVAGGGGGSGLDLSIVDSFPSFTYSTVKDYTKERYGLECAICLIEFRSSDVLRLLTSCCHVFHQECIDLWLESHKTCPVCRRNLDSPVASPVKSPCVTSNDVVRPTAENEAEATAHGDCCRITIMDEKEEEEDASRVRVRVSEEDDTCTTSAQSERDKFSRSHSTGHSITRNREGEDRFTLILPEEVKSRIIKGHNSSKSWTNFGEYNNKDKSVSNNNDNNIAETVEVPAGADKV